MTKHSGISNYKELMGRFPVPPAVSIFLPRKEVFSSKADLQHRVKIAIENVRHRLQQDFTADMAHSLAARLERLQAQLDYEGAYRSIALFVSPNKGESYYLDTMVEERTVIGETFAVRDLVADSKRLHEHLVLVASEDRCIFYLASNMHLTVLEPSSPVDVYAYVNEKPERVANFSDPIDRRQIVMDKFLHHIDEELSHMLARHPLPVFVLAPEKVAGHFRTYSSHRPQIVGYVQGNYIEAGESELQSVIEPCLSVWRQQNLRNLLAQLEQAADRKTLNRGVIDAWAAVWQNNGKLLVVEESYRFCARHGDKGEKIFREDNPASNPFYIQDAVDALIGETISRGGDVEFVGDGMLKAYEHIALIRHY